MKVTPKSILLTNGRSPMTLYLARLFHYAGHKIYVTDPQALHYCRLSNSVEKNFKVPSPRFEPEAYIEVLSDIVNNYHIDLLIPTWEDTLLISQFKEAFDKRCHLYVTDFDLLATVHDKWRFMKFLESLNIETPKTQLIRHQDDLKKIDMDVYALKPKFSRSSKQVYKIHKGDPLPDIEISDEEEWVAQEWHDGNILCSYTLCNQGKIYAHSVYPMEFIRDRKQSDDLNAGSYCLSYTSVEHKALYEWVEKFVALTGYTGQLAFDFFERSSGEVYAFECNPRLTCGVTLFQPQDRLDKAFLGECEAPIFASNDSMTQIFFAMLFMGWQPAIFSKKVRLFIKKLLRAEDIIFNKFDIKPFIFQPLIWIKIYFNSLIQQSSIPSSFTYDLDYNGELTHAAMKFPDDATQSV